MCYMILKRKNMKRIVAYDYLIINKWGLEGNGLNLLHVMRAAVHESRYLC